MNTPKSYWHVISASLVFLLFIACILLYSRIIIEGDGISYYALALSLSEDGDFDLENQKREISGIMAPIHPVTKKNASLFSAGFGVIYAPFLKLSDLASSVFPKAEQWRPYKQNSEIRFLHAAGIFAGSLIFSAGSLFLAWRLIKEKLVLRISAAWIPFCIFAGTPLIFYTLTMPAYAHAADAFITTAIFYLVFRPKLHRQWQIILQNILIGALLAISVLLRNNNVVLIIPAVLGRLYYARSREEQSKFLTGMLIFAGALPFAGAHALFNLSQYGSVIATGYKVQTEASFLFEMLFSYEAGLFIWSPVALIGLAGLITGTIRRHTDAIISLSAVLLVFLSVQFQPNWWGGCSFGQRFFTHLFLFWCLGVVQLIPISRWTLLPVSACALWTFLLFNVFYMNVSTEQGWALLKKDKCRHTPYEMLIQASSDLRSAKNEGRIQGISQFWYSALGKRYPTLIHLLYRSGS